MRPPLAGRRDAARRLAEDVGRRLAPLQRVVPIRLPGGRPGAGVGHAAPADRAPQAAPATPAQDAEARIDAARERLRATVRPPPEDGGDPSS